MTHDLPNTPAGLTVPATIAELIAERAAATPEAPALLAPGCAPLSFRQLRACLWEIGSALRRLGLGAEDCVAVVLPNGPEMAVAFLAVAAVAVCAPLNPAYREGEFAYALESLRAKALILGGEMDGAAAAAANTLGVPVLPVPIGLHAEAGRFSLAGTAPGDADVVFSAADATALVLHTSGTTARPKVVPLTQRNLCASAAQIRASLALGPDDRCLNVMPLFHIHGLVGALLSSLSAGAGVICTPGFRAPGFFPWMDACAPTWYTAVPTMHQAVLAQAVAHREIIARHPLRFIRSCSAPLPPAVMAELEQTFGAPVIEAYGMTEAAHQIASNPLPPRPRKPGSVGIPSGTEGAVMDDAGRLLPAGARGEVVIRGRNVMPGYADNPAANQAAFTHGWFRTGDQGYLDDDGYLFLTGRIKELINRGGEKISPREIDEVLLEHPAVAQALAFAVPHPQLGEEVAAAVVPRAPGMADERELRLFVAERLADFKVPRRVVLVDEIPKGPTGKPQRIGLAERLGVQAALPAASADFVAPSTPTETRLAELWASVLGLERVGVQDDFLFLGGDSVLATLLLSRIREAYQLSISPVDFFAAPTIAAQARLIDRQAQHQAAVMAELLERLDGLSEEDALRMLHDERPSS